MTAIEPQIADGSRYSITEAAEILGLHRNTLRQHTKEGLVKCGFRRKTYRKFYTGFELKRYWRAQY